MSLKFGFWGAFLGGILGGPLGAIIGGGIGLILPQNNSKSPAYSAGEYFEMQKALFRCLGKLAKSDGRVSQAEADLVRELLHELCQEKELRTQLIAEFNHGRDSSKSFAELVIMFKAYAELFPQAEELKQNAIHVFCILAAADHQLSSAENEMLKQASELLGYPEMVKAFFRGYRFDSADCSSANETDLASCYDALEISPDATDQEVKKAYRKKAAQFHPDKVQSANVSGAYIQEAHERFIKISNAYETIMKVRKNGGQQ